MSKDGSKHPTSIRLSDEALRLRLDLAVHLGIGLAEVVEMAIRKLAKAEGVK